MDTIINYIDELSIILDNLPVDKITEVVDILYEARIQGKKVFTMGNGGSASTASHFVCDLAKNTRVEGLPPFKVIGLADNIPSMTAYANDEGYENIFSQQLFALMEPGDIVIGISTSGNSPNVISAIDVANQNGARTIGFTGMDGGLLAKRVDLNISVPTNCIEQVEDLHLILEHMITKTLREELCES